ncbi:hypothetical protein JW756_02175 [Candidatus Woesearchaeota archaeon]|nr:hypothetical protein [Candidatus Woesearchaeota archaeon]
MMKNKRGNVFWIIMEIAVAIAILIILIFIIRGGFKNFITGLNSCEAKGGECLSSCGDREAIPAGDAGCEKEYRDKGYVCCKKTDTGAQTGAGANSEAIKVSLNGEKTALTYGERRDIYIGNITKIDTVLIYSKLKSLQNVDTTKLVCSLFLKDMDTVEEFAMYRSKEDLMKESDDLIKGLDLTLKDITETYGTGSDYTAFIVPCSEATNDKIWYRFFKAEELQAGSTYALRIIIYNKAVSDAVTKGGYTDDNGYTDEFKALILDETNWIAEFTSYLRIKPIIEIKDISGTWVAFDDITVTANPPYTLSNVSVAIVPGDGNLPADEPNSEPKSLFQKIYDACVQLNNDHKEKYFSRLNKIKSIKAGTQGVNLGFTALGREAYQEAFYDSDPLSIEIINGQAKIHIDASSIAKDFNIQEMKVEKELQKGESLKEQYLCVKAQVMSGGKMKEVISTSTQPLRLDVAPPKIEETDEYIKVVYPDYQTLKDSITKLIEQNRILPNQQVTPYYFEQYPKIKIVKCIDKSGCKYYNYYFAPTNIRININTNDLETGIVSTILGYGLNYLYQQIVASNPLDTICPLANSGQYRQNTFPEIRFYKDQQGIFCIKAIDATGNYWLTWKTAYNPYDVIGDVAAGVTSGAGSGTTITPTMGSK